MKQILNFKHWQLFILIVLTGSWISPSPLQEIVNLIGSISFTVWIYAIGFYGQKKLEALKLQIRHIKLFKINIILGPIILFAVFILSPEQLERNAYTEFDSQSIILSVMACYAFFALFQTIIFACKTLTLIELKREVRFADYIGNFILVLFFIVGVWWLQPKVTRLIADTD